MAFYFDLEKSKLKQKAKVVAFAKKSYVKFLVFLVYLAGLLSLTIVILTFSNILFLTKFEFSIFSFFSLIFLFFISFHIYYVGGIKKPKLPYSIEEARRRKNIERINLADFLTIPAYLLIERTFEISKLKQINDKILLRLLLHDEKIQFILNRMGLKVNEFLTGLENYYKEKTFIQPAEEIISKALEIAFMQYHERIEVGDILVVLALTDPYFNKVLFDLNLKPEDVFNIAYWQTTFWREKEQKKFDPEKIKLTGGIGKDWAAGYTPILSRYAQDISREISKFGFPLHIIGHTKEIEELEKILIRATHHNVLLVGEAGIGKKTIVLGLAKRITEGQTYRALAFRHIMALDINFLLAGAETPGEIVARLSGILSDAVRAGNIILFIDGIHTLFGGGTEGSKIGAIDASSIIIPYLEHPGLYFIATTDPENYHLHIETKGAVAEKFEKIEVKEPKAEEVIRILEDITPQVEIQSGVVISYEALKSIVKLAEQFLYTKPFPEKAIDLLNEVVVYAASTGKKTIVMPFHVQKVIEQKTGVPIGEAKKFEREKLLRLEEILHQRVIGQDEAIKMIANAMRRARAGVEVSKKPIGSFLFLGPTGVGKTETCKALAEVYFGSENAMIRFDMSEYQDIQGIYRLIGAPTGTPEARAGGLLTSAVRDHPFSLVLLDEIEKAHPDILNLFLQVLDEGWLTDSLGRKVKFNNTIIIATSNAGAELIREGIKKGLSPSDIRKKLWDWLQKKGVFRPEFLNRFTAVVTFNPLTPTEVEKITGLLIKKLAKNLKEEKGIFLEVEPQALTKLAKIGFDPMLGARPIQRVIQRKIEDILAKKILAGEIKRGDRLIIKENDISEKEELN